MQNKIFPQFLRKSIISIISLLLMAMIFLTACQPNTPQNDTEQVQNVEIQDTTQPAPPTVTPFPTATSAPPRSLVVCLGQEPSSLYLYGGTNMSTWSVLEALYDGPFDWLSFEAQPVILEQLPNFADGSARYQTISMKEGSLFVDPNGDLQALKAGMRVIPAGCTDVSCVIEWDGQSDLQMEQLVLDFKLLSGLQWADGQPLTAADSLYSFNLAADMSTPVSKTLIYKTESYTALDEHQVRWVGTPGYQPQRFDQLFWIPMPEHVWGAYSAADLLTADISAAYPLGWGAYKIDEWVRGDHITLSKNPFYFRSVEGLPNFDALVYRFLGRENDNDLAALLAGECDIVDQTTFFDDQLDLVMELDRGGKIKALITESAEWAQLAVGIGHVSLDDGYYIFADDRADYFADTRVRQAFAYCIDRQALVDDLLQGFSSVPDGFIHPQHPDYNEELTALPYDVSLGRELLDQAGWKEWDGNPDTPLQAISIPNVPDGTFLTLEYYTTEAELRKQVAMRLAENLGDCGVQLNIHYLPPDELFASGPDGIIFGRQFDLAQFSWKTGSMPACQFYETNQIPNLENNWLTVNVSGFSDQEFDLSCQLLRSTRLNEEDLLKHHQLDVQTLFAQQLPVLPLYYRLKIAAARADICGLEMDTTARSLLWSLEEVDYGSDCE